MTKSLQTKRMYKIYKVARGRAKKILEAGQREKKDDALCLLRDLWDWVEVIISMMMEERIKNKNPPIGPPPGGEEALLLLDSIRPVKKCLDAKDNTGFVESMKPMAKRLEAFISALEGKKQ